MQDHPTPVPLSRGWAADAAPLGIVALSRDGTILYANPAMESILDADSGALVGVDAHNFHAIPELGLAMARDLRVADRVQGLEVALVGFRDREVSVRISAVLMEGGPAGAAVVAMVEDITTVRAREASESQARTMTAVGRLAGGMAHHFNNLLASILGQVSLLEDTVATTPDGRSGLQEIATAARRAKEIADLLLIVSGKEVGVRQAVDLGRWLYEAAAPLRSALPDDVELVVRAHSGKNGVQMDRERLRRILEGLVMNANEALPDGGTILLEVGPFDPQGDEEVLFSPPLGRGPYVCLTVADDGLGMNEETLGRALEPFFSTKRDREGAGLGLATIYGIVVQSGGHLALESAPIIGTRARILLPLFDREAEDESEQARPPLMAEGWGVEAAMRVAELAGDNAPQRPAPMVPLEIPEPEIVSRPPAPVDPAEAPRLELSVNPAPPEAAPPEAAATPGVLIVDDEDTIRRVMEKILSRDGFTVFTAIDGRDAQRVWGEHESEISMVVTDVMMPRMNGAELIEWLRSRRPDLAYLMVSGFSGSPLVQAWVDQDPDSFLAKPFEAPEFLERVRQRWGQASSVA